MGRPHVHLFVVCAWALLACGISAVGEGPSAAPQEEPFEAGGGSSSSGGSDGQTSTASDGATSPDGSIDAPMDAPSDAPPADPYTTRITSGLVAFYDFEENTGSKAGDSIAPAYDLTIADTGRRTWHTHYLTLTDYTALSNSATFQKLVTRATVTHEFTVELWVKVDAYENDNPCRLVSMIQDSSNRDIDMGVDGSSLWATTTSSTQMQSSPYPSTLFHLVVTRSSNGTLSMYVNGTFRQSTGSASDPATWPAYKLFVMNSYNDDRGVRGDLHLLAFYDVALSATNVLTNYNAGPDPK